MANITDRTAYLRGLAEGMKLDREVNEQRLILEMLDVMDEMSHQLADVNDSVDELNEYVEDIDNDLSDMEDVLFGDDDCDCDCDCGCEDDGEDEDDAEIRPRGFERSAVMRMEVFAQRLGRAAEIADAHGAGVGVAPHLAEGLHLHGADERNERVGSRVALLRQKADEEQQHDLRQKNELPPVYPLHVLEMPMNTLSHENTQHEREHRHKIAPAVRPVTIEKIGAEEHDVARLRVGEDLAAAKVGVGIL